MKNKIFKGIAVLAVVALISGATILATQASAGTSSDPLITLSYLNGPFKKLIEGDIQTALKPLTTRVSTAENRISSELKTAQNNTANVFRYSSLASGKTLTLEAGSEIMLRSGTVTYSGELTRTSGTTGVASSGSLVANNMYIATGKVTLTATSAATLWVRTAPTVTLTASSDFGLSGGFEAQGEPGEATPITPSGTVEPSSTAEPTATPEPTDTPEPTATP